MTNEMTAEEAIKILNDIDFCNGNTCENCKMEHKCSDIDKVKDMAIQALESSTHIPQNATNGDVIKAVFPDAISVYAHKGGSIYRTTGDEYIITSEFWNAPYREGDEFEVE